MCLSEELHASRIIRAFMRENMPVLVQGNAIDLVAEIDKTIDAEGIKSAGGSAQIMEKCCGLQMIFQCQKLPVNLLRIVLQQVMNQNRIKTIAQPLNPENI